jgi:hypothetical protein
MRFLRLAALAAMLLTAAPLGARAALLDFTFTFTNQQSGFTGGTVTGVVRGLSDNATSAASSVEILSNSAGFGLGEYVGNPIRNSWTLVAGAITVFNFGSGGAANTAPAVTCCALTMNTAIGVFLNSNPSFTSGPVGTPTITFTRVEAPVDVPEPATALILGPALLLGGLALRRRRAAG